MKKIYLGLLTVIAVFVSCNKESDIESISGITLHTISATIDEDNAKATYNSEGVFSWQSGDIISYIVRNTGDNKYNRYQYNTTGSGATASFSGEPANATWAAADYAYYPYDGTSGYTNNTLGVPAATTMQAQLYGTIKAYPDRLKGIVPMIGKKVSTDASGTLDHYHFYPVTGVLKLSFTGIPATATQIRLDVPNAATYPLNGVFNVDTERAIPEIKATDVVTGYSLKYLNFDYSGSDDTFYIPLPTGTIPAGKLTVSVSDGTNSLYSVVNQEDIIITRGEITALPSITVPSVKVKISGTATTPTATFFFSGDVAKVKYAAGMSSPSIGSATISTSGTTINMPNNGYSFLFYFKYQAYNSSDEKVGSETELRYWALDASDQSIICQTFNPSIGISVNSSTSTLTHTAPFADYNTASITFAPSDNPSLGNVMITEFCGVSGKAYGNYVQLYYSGGWKASDNPIITMNNAYNMAHPFCKVGGTPYYFHGNAYNQETTFRVRTKKYNTNPAEYYSVSPWSLDCELACWNTSVGLSSSNSTWDSPLHITYYVVPRE